MAISGIAGVNGIPYVTGVMFDIEGWVHFESPPVEIALLGAGETSQSPRCKITL